MSTDQPNLESSPADATSPKRYEQFDFEDSFLIFQVENTLFRVKSKYFSRSVVFRDMFTLKLPNSGMTGEDIVQGLTDEHPIHLPEQKADFFAFTLSILSFVYDGGRSPNGSRDQWIAALRFADKYQIVAIARTILINLYEELGVHLSWTADAIAALLKTWETTPLKAKDRAIFRKRFLPGTWDVISTIRENHLVFLHSDRCDLPYLHRLTETGRVLYWMEDALDAEKISESKKLTMWQGLGGVLVFIQSYYSMIILGTIVLLS